MEEEKTNEIEEVEEKQEEKKKSNILINILILLVIFIISVIMYGKYIGTKGIVIKEYRIKDELIPKNFSGVKVIFISDILLGSTINLEDIEEMTEKINKLKPDIILFGGGLTSNNYDLNDEKKESLIETLNKIDVKLGKYAVKGVNDNEVFDEVMNASGFKILSNSFELIYNEDTTPICLIGVGSYNAGSYDLTTSFEFFNTIPNCYTIVITHESDIIDNIMALEHKPNVILTGNTLGGEINIPFYGPLVKNEGSINYYLDYYELENTKIFISSGLGTKEYDMRLFNHPSFNFFRLKS